MEMTSSMNLLKGNAYYSTGIKLIISSSVMEIDEKTYTDLSVFDIGLNTSIFSKLNLCTTTGGRDKLYDHFTTPLKTIAEIEAVMRPG